MKLLNILKAKFIVDINNIRVILMSSLLLAFLMGWSKVFTPLFIIAIVIELLEMSYDVKQKYTPMTHPIVAIDIDGTIVNHLTTGDNGSLIGEPFEHAIETINRMKLAGYEIILWSERTSDVIIECKKMLLNYGLSPDVKFKIPSLEDPRNGMNVSKVPAFVYIDNNNYGSLDYDFSIIWSKIHKDFLGMTPEGYKRSLNKK